MINIQDNLNLYNFENFEIKTLVINSSVLKNNPLGDNPSKVNPIFYPKNQKDLPVILLLPGFGGHGGKFFSFASFEKSQIENLEMAIREKKAPNALYVFVDAWTFWGGSQFINSIGCGSYEDYIIQELIPAIKKEFPVKTDPRSWTVAGGSSGGYGAIHLGTKYPEIFSQVAAIAPDSFFNLSLLPEIYSVFPVVNKWGGVNGIRKAISEGHILNRKDSHKILNVIAMGLCYSANEFGEINWPINKDGELLDKEWKAWLKHDPLLFLENRKENLLKLNSIYLDVGQFDEFHLQFGARQIFKFLKSLGVNLKYNEYKGSHYDISERRSEMFQWINFIYAN